MTDALSDSAIAAIADLAVDVEISERESQNESPVIPRDRKNARGRAAFAADICEIHPTYHGQDGFVVASADKPCAKFGHLPGNGRGPYRPNMLRKTRSFVVGLIKPVVLIGLVVGALYCGKVFLPNLFSADRFIPSAPSSGAGTNADSNGNRNGDATTRDGNGDSASNGIAGTRHAKSCKANAKRNSGDHSATSTRVNDCRPAAKKSVKP